MANNVFVSIGWRHNSVCLLQQPPPCGAAAALANITLQQCAAKGPGLAYTAVPVSSGPS